MTKQAVFRLLLATFAVTALVNSSYAREVEAPGELNRSAPLDLSARTLRRAARVSRLRVFIVDTRDQAACSAFRHVLETMRPARVEDQASRLCEMNSDEPIVSVVAIDEADSEAFRRALNLRSLEASDQKLATAAREFALRPGESSGVLWTSPQGVVKWDKPKTVEDQQGIFDRGAYKRPAGTDETVSTYVAKPLAGVASYTMARQQGKSPLESFGSSIATSTFFWEYGFDSAPTAPAVQDLLLSPVVGAVLGEYLIGLEKSIRDHHGEVFGSKAAGSLTMAVINPAGTLSDAMNRAAGRRIIQNAHSELVLRRYNSDFGQQTNLIGVQMVFQFKPH